MGAGPLVLGQGSRRATANPTDGLWSSGACGFGLASKVLPLLPVSGIWAASETVLLGVHTWSLSIF